MSGEKGKGIFNDRLTILFSNGKDGGRSLQVCFSVLAQSTGCSLHLSCSLLLLRTSYHFIHRGNVTGNASSKISCTKIYCFFVSVLAACDISLVALVALCCFFFFFSCSHANWIYMLQCFQDHCCPSLAPVALLRAGGNRNVTAVIAALAAWSLERELHQALIIIIFSPYFILPSLSLWHF